MTLAITETTPEAMRDKIAEWLEYRARVYLSSRSTCGSRQEASILYDKAEAMKETAAELRAIPCL